MQVAVAVRLGLHAVRPRRREARLRVGERGDLLLAHLFTKAEPRIRAKAQHNTALAAQQRAARGVRVLDGE